MIKAVLQLTLVYPYVNSLLNLFGFLSLWRGNLISAGTLDSKATIAIPANKFKHLFGENPRKGRYVIPKSMEYFLEDVIIVKDVITK